MEEDPKPRRHMDIMRRPVATPRVVPHPKEALPRISSPFSRRRWVVWAAGMLVLAILFLGTARMVWPKPAMIPVSVRKSVAFTLYEPRDIPDGFTLDKTSFSTATQVMTFAITHGNQKLQVSEQPKPADFDFENFYKQIKGDAPVAAKAGTMVTGRLDDAWLVSVLADQTWILIRAPQDLPKTQLEAIARSLQPSPH